eukprot:SAG22_NODE_1812_length_3525_cov_1.386165_5_plen_122_part_00
MEGIEPQHGPSLGVENSWRFPTTVSLLRLRPLLLALSQNTPFPLYFGLPGPIVQPAQDHLHHGVVEASCSTVLRSYRTLPVSGTVLRTKFKFSRTLVSLKFSSGAMFIEVCHIFYGCTQVQ